MAGISDARDLLRRRLRGLMRVEASPRSAYLAMSELLRRYAGADVPPAPDGSLTAHELRVFSQNGEDGVIAELIARCGAPGRWFVEFGAGDGHENNCAALADLLGWSGLFIEADEELHAALEAKYRAVEPVRTVRAAVSAENIERLFEGAGVPEEPDVVSIDVDGPDLWVWRAIERYRPRIVVVEYNASLGAERSLVQPRDHDAPWDNTEFGGASIRALTELGREKGYRLVHTDLTGTNAFFVREDLGADLPAEPRVHGPNHLLAGGGHKPDPLSRGYSSYP
jgi:hypothetical protein